VLVVFVALGAWFLGRHDEPSRDTETSAGTTPVAPAAAGRPREEPAPAPAEEAPSERPRPRRRATTEPKPEPAPAAPTAGELRIDSDVPGAMVFLDRKYLGETPVTAKDVEPGTHQLNLSAEGHEGQSRTIDVKPGPAEIMVRFKEIRLEESVDVVHKHGVGSCEGRLLADPKGLRYETTNKNDAFTLAFDQIETFEVDYLKKNLRVKRRGGKTWNFTTRHENADPIFVFHRNVQKVRDKIGAGQ
jgi:hypothetical protein